MEENSDDWKELRARVDTLSNSVFVLAAGAITLSVSALFNIKTSEFSSLIPSVNCIAVYSWIFLLGAILLFILLKIHLVLQAYARLHKTKFYSNTDITNIVGWCIGFFGVVALTLGLSLLIFIASRVLNA